MHNAIVIIEIGIIAFICYMLISLYFIIRLPKNNPKRFLKRGTQLSGQKRHKFVLIGDSITHGTLSENYSNILAERLHNDEYPVDIINAGVNIDYAYNVLQRVDDIIRCKPDFITILIGTNDAVNSSDQRRNKLIIWFKKLPQIPTLEFFQENLQKIVSRLKAETKAKIAILSLPTIGEDLEHPAIKLSSAFSKAIQKIAEQQALDYLPLHEKMIRYLNEHPANPMYVYEQQDFAMIKGVVKHMLGYNYQRISEDIGFHLHIDFLHLNRAGASMVVDLIESYYRKHSELAR